MAHTAVAAPWRRLGGGLFMLLLGATFLYFLVPEIRANLAAVGWRAVPCTIRSSGVESEQSAATIDAESLYRAQIRFAYVMNGAPYESTRYRFLDPYTNDPSAAQGAVSRYPAGSTATCYVDPKNPREAVLERQRSPFMLVALIPGAFALAGVWSLAALGIAAVRR